MDDAQEMLRRACDDERRGRTAEAEAAFRRILAGEPRNAEALRRLGLLMLDAGQLHEALALARRAVAAAPTAAENHSAVGRVLTRLREFEAALAAHALAVQLAPHEAALHYEFGRTQWRAGRLEAAEAAFRRVEQMEADFAPAQDALARLLFEAGRLDELSAGLRERIAKGRATPMAEDLFLFAQHFHPRSTPATLREEHARWNARHAAPLRGSSRPHANDRAPARRLRIGYVSADLREHPVAHAVLPLLAHHDRERFEIFAYSGATAVDAVTARCRTAVDGWRDVARLGDEELAEQIRADRIDVLVDLSLHTTGHRLLVFARKPAPVQVTWAGYPGSTGLDAIDYRLADRFLDPPEREARLYAEKSVRLPDSFWCYDPLGAQPAVNPAPALEAGAVTFGCLNKCAKVNAGTVALWARVLRAAPRSRMIVRAVNDASRERIQRLFCAQDIEPARIECVGWRPRPEYLAVHHRIDIALDPIPYGGHVTLLDGLWMGVPAIVLPGDTAVSRAGLSLLANVGMPEWVAASPEDFVRIAVGQTRDLGQLAALRAGLRSRLEASALMDGRRFARGVERAYRAMWETWCEKRGAA